MFRGRPALFDRYAFASQVAVQRRNSSGAATLNSGKGACSEAVCLYVQVNARKERKMSKTLVLIIAVLAVSVCLAIGVNAKHVAVDQQVVQMRRAA